jgi:macrodomain Ter protein organizer (MatP/YcbG family)
MKFLMSEREHVVLVKLAREWGVTVSDCLRELIRDASSGRYVSRRRELLSEREHLVLVKLAHSWGVTVSDCLRELIRDASAGQRQGVSNMEREEQG